MPNHTDCIWAVSCRRQERNILGVYAEMPDKTSAEKIILSYVGKGNAAWLQLYAFLCAQTGRLITGRLPGAKAINALIQAEKTNVNQRWMCDYF